VPASRSGTGEGGIPIDQQLIDGRYSVIERIGKGAMGVVYKAHDAVLDRVVAIKQMVGELDDDPQLKARFIQEARSAARLNHRNIVTIYELHESDQDIYIVMELLEGVDLATLIKRHVPLPIEARLNMMAQLCDGLEYAHGKGIIHRDIKPANLHVSPSGLVTILDFGIARLAQSKMTSTGGLIGTPDYMSPEQVMAGKLDARSDLFAVGAVTYELLCGSKPFEAESITALLMKIAREPHTPLRERAPHLPGAAIDLVERLLQKNPDDRPSSAREVQQALLAISTERPPLDAATMAILAGAITEETLRPRTPVPATRSPKKPTTAPARPSTDSSSRLASLAIERGRALRESGDLGGAMKVFRSVLEIAPGNAEALRELEEMERAFSRITASGRVQPAAPAQAAPPAPPVEPPPTARGVVPPGPARPDEPTVLGPGRLPPPLPVSPPPPRGTPAAARPPAVNIALIATISLIAVALGAASVYLWSMRRGTGPTPETQTAALTTTTAPTPAAPTTTVPAAAAAPAVTTTSAPPAAAVSVVTPPPPPSVAPPPATSDAAKKPTVRDAAGRSAQPPVRTETARGAAESTQVTTSVPVTVAPTTSVVPPPPPPETTTKTVAPAPPAMMLRHFHGRALFKGKFSSGFCDGTVEIQPDGIYFKTTVTSDGRQDTRKIPFKTVEDVELDGSRLHIETEDKEWDFGGAKDLLQQLEKLLKANMKSDQSPI
jgi:eukaryotic-like serine/threonine-protein kinase